ncbi:hypothetical protein OSTOST_24788 [Ostertagia ostertagi]
MENECKWPVLRGVHESPPINTPRFRCYYHPLLVNTVGKVIIGEAKKVKFDEPMEVRHNQIVVECYRDSAPEECALQEGVHKHPSLYRTRRGIEIRQKRSGTNLALAILVSHSVSLHLSRGVCKTHQFLIDSPRISLRVQYVHHEAQFF